MCQNGRKHHFHHPRHLDISVRKKRIRRDYVGVWQKVKKRTVLGMLIIPSRINLKHGKTRYKPRLSRTSLSWHFWSKPCRKVMNREVLTLGNSPCEAHLSACFFTFCHSQHAGITDIYPHRGDQQGAHLPACGPMVGTVRLVVTTACPTVKRVSVTGTTVSAACLTVSSTTLCSSAVSLLHGQRWWGRVQDREAERCTQECIPGMYTQECIPSIVPRRVYPA